jgi:hypothetical protein
MRDHLDQHLAVLHGVSPSWRNDWVSFDNHLVWLGQELCVWDFFHGIWKGKWQDPRLVFLSAFRSTEARDVVYLVARMFWKGTGTDVLPDGLEGPANVRGEPLL